MKAVAIKTERVSTGSISLTELLDKYLTEFKEGNVLAITSKIVAICEGSVVAKNTIVDKQAFVAEHADFTQLEAHSKYGINFTIKNNTLIPNAGIDESNAGDFYILWPKDSQATSAEVRAYLKRRFSLQHVGVVITDSTCRLMRRGVSGIALGFSGFNPLHNYVGTPDLFGRDFKVSQADIVGGLAGIGVFVMGEGSESTPLAVISELNNVEFVDREPTNEELKNIAIPLEEDLFEPFLSRVKWLRKPD
jgi:putative folate metabolism gamma-glutamate ligase